MSDSRSWKEHQEQQSAAGRVKHVGPVGGGIPQDILGALKPDKEVGYDIEPVCGGKCK